MIDGLCKCSESTDVTVAADAGPALMDESADWEGWGTNKASREIDKFHVHQCQAQIEI